MIVDEFVLYFGILLYEVVGGDIVFVRIELQFNVVFMLEIVELNVQEILDKLLLCIGIQFSNYIIKIIIVQFGFNLVQVVLANDVELFIFIVVEGGSEEFQEEGVVVVVGQIGQR